ncbi:MAG: triose-phosphate isomerase [Arsenophonus endosymbiont of Ceratovacuna japonica]
MRHPLVIGNWKLNGSTKMVKELIEKLHNELNNIINCNIAIAPPTLYLSQAKKALINSNITLAAQDVDINLFGAFTGDNSAEMLKDIGVKYVIIGHSERRIYHNETDELIAQKFSILKSQGLIPVLCIGESKEENNAGKTEQVCANQIDKILHYLSIDAFKNSVIAYEPIWAIGTYKSATPTQAQSVHKFIRNHIAKQDPIVAEKIIIQYGGSVNVNNASKLFVQPDIDGALVGGESLKAHSFISIVNTASIIKKVY